MLNRTSGKVLSHFRIHCLEVCAWLSWSDNLLLVCLNQDWGSANDSGWLHMKKETKNVRTGASGRLVGYVRSAGGRLPGHIRAASSRPVETSGRPVDAYRAACVQRPVDWCSWPVDQTAFNETYVLSVFTRARVFQTLGVAIFGPPTGINRILKAGNKLDHLRASKILRRKLVLVRSSSRTNLAFALLWLEGELLWRRGLHVHAHTSSDQGTRE